jgi:hypothetical protein
MVAPAGIVVPSASVMGFSAKRKNRTELPGQHKFVLEGESSWSLGSW